MQMAEMTLTPLQISFTPSHINLYTSQMNLHGDIIQTNWLPRVK